MEKLLIVMALFLFVSCSKDDNSGDVRSSEFEVIKTVLPQGPWKVDYFYNANEDHTIDFESFTFTFKADGTIEAQTDLFTESGTWLYENFPEEEEQLNLQFDGTIPFDQINLEWKIISVTNSKVELSYETTSTEGTKLLSFIKI